MIDYKLLIFLRGFVVVCAWMIPSKEHISFNFGIYGGKFLSIYLSYFLFIYYSSFFIGVFLPRYVLHELYTKTIFVHFFCKTATAEYLQLNTRTIKTPFTF